MQLSVLTNFSRKGGICTMRNRKLNKQSGFTIIEVLIVLAIAGLILLVVFLAVPGLQRNSHNTSAKNDVGTVLGAMSEYGSNNSGSLPPTETAGNMGTAGAKVAYVGDTQTNCSAANNTKNCATAKVGYFDPAKISIVTAVPTSAPANGNLVIIEKATCKGNAPSTAAVDGASSRTYAAYYTLEGGAVQCQAS